MRPGGEVRPRSTIPRLATPRLIFFEKLFFMLDTQVYLLWACSLGVQLGCVLTRGTTRVCAYLLTPHYPTTLQAKGFMQLKDAADLLSFTALGMSDQQVQDA